MVENFHFIKRIRVKISPVDFLVRERTLISKPYYARNNFTVGRYRFAFPIFEPIEGHFLAELKNLTSKFFTPAKESPSVDSKIGRANLYIDLL